MPPLPGEERMLTVFADIHSYFSEPAPKPVRHRFDKGSYLYVHYDASQPKSRIEVANNPGTPDQDAFNGALDRIHISHSTQFPTLCTLTVDGPDPNPQAFPTPPSPASLYEWRLPSGDPRDQQGDLLRLHTLDIYFWTVDDAYEFLGLMEHLLSPSQVESDRRARTEEGIDTTAPTANNNVSNVVQQLENIAVTDPAYQKDTPNSNVNTTPETQHHPVPGIGAIPPPPPAPTTTATAATVPVPAPVPSQSPPQQATPVSQTPVPAPLPYNPAAPAAPEPIQHREKTPPPVDAADGTGLAAAVAADNGIPYTPAQPQTPNFAPPPTTPGQQVLTYSIPGGYASPPPSAGLPPSSAPGLTHSGSLSSRSSSVQGPPAPSGVMPGYAPSPSSPFFPGNVSQPINRTGSISFAPPPQQQLQVQPQPQPQPQAQDPNMLLYQQNLQQQQQQVSQQQQYMYAQQPQQPQQPQHQLFHAQFQQQLPQQQQPFNPQMGSFPPTITGQPGQTPSYPYDLSQTHASSPKLPYTTEYDANPNQVPRSVVDQQGANNGGNGQRPGKLENRAARMESGVNRFLKKLEKRL